MGSSAQIGSGWVAGAGSGRFRRVPVQLQVLDAGSGGSEDSGGFRCDDRRKSRKVLEGFGVCRCRAYPACWMWKVRTRWWCNTKMYIANRRGHADTPPTRKQKWFQQSCDHCIYALHIYVPAVGDTTGSYFSRELQAMGVLTSLWPPTFGLGCRQDCRCRPGRCPGCRGRCCPGRCPGAVVTSGYRTFSG